MIDLLSNPGIDVNVWDHAHSTILHHIIELKDWDLLEKVLWIEHMYNTFNFDQEDSYGETCRESFLRMYNGYFSKGNPLLFRLQSLEKADFIDNLIFCLKKETKYSFKSIVRFTRQKENDFFERDKSKNLITLLQKCKNDKNDEKVSRVYNALNFQTHTMVAGRPLLMYVIESDNFNVVKFLIQKNADVNLQYLFRKTALTCAVENNNLNIVTLLVANGANVNLKDDDNKTALIWAHIRGYKKIIQFLVKNGAIDSLFIQELNEKVKKRLGKGVNVNVRDRQDKTKLMYAAQQGKFDIVQHLVNNNTNVNVQNCRGNTALMFAVENGHYKIVQYLVENHANVNLQNEWNDTALIIARRKGHHNIAQFLIENNAIDVMKQDLNERLKIANI